MSKTRTLTGAGAITTAALVLIFGNEAATDFIARHPTDGVKGWLFDKLTWPSWTTGLFEEPGPAIRDLLARDVKALLLIGFVAGIVALCGKMAKDAATGFMVGWAAVIFASALAAFSSAFIFEGATVLKAFVAADSGSAYGLFVGWIVGIATAIVAGKKGGGS